MIKTGKEINITDRAIADKQPNFIIALNHGITPGSGLDDSYAYYLIPNIGKEEMKARVANLQKTRLPPMRYIPLPTRPGNMLSSSPERFLQERLK